MARRSGWYLVKDGDVVFVELGNRAEYERRITLGYAAPQRAPIDAALMMSWDPLPTDPSTADLRRLFSEEIGIYHGITDANGMMVATATDAGLEYMRALTAASSALSELESGLIPVRDAAAIVSGIAAARAVFVEELAARP